MRLKIYRASFTNTLHSPLSTHFNQVSMNIDEYNVRERQFGAGKFTWKQRKRKLKINKSSKGWKKIEKGIYERRERERVSERVE